MSPRSEGPVRSAEWHWNRLLRALREAGGLTQDGFAARLGIGSRTVRRWERGAAAPDAATEAALLALYETKGLFRRYESGPLAGMAPSAAWLSKLLTDARLELSDRAAAVPVAQQSLPIPPTSLVGREHEVETLAALLHDGARLVTLTGPGGSGKTRLAIELATELNAEFQDGAFFVSLADIGDPVLVPPAIAQALDVREARRTGLLDSLKSFLRERSLLLLLDNFEQVLDAAPIVAELLGASPGLRVIVTSRAAFRVRGEREFPVPPLALPDLGQAPDPAALFKAPAVSLFLDRARAVKPDLAVADETVHAVAEICARLDGLPLAIELAAARCRLLPPSALLARLAGSEGGSPLQLLSSGARDLPARQRTLRDTIAWSYDLLSTNEQTLFRRLAVFSGGFTIEAAEAASNEQRATGNEARGGIDSVGARFIASAAPRAGYVGEERGKGTHTLDLLASLVDKNLIREAEAEAEGAEARFRMLETVREFGLEMLAANGELGVAKRAHADYFLTLAEKSGPQLRGPNPAPWFDRLAREHDNLRAALRWLIEDHDGERALRLGAVLGWFWYVRGHLHEAQALLGAALEMPESAAYSAPRAQICWLAALSTFMLGDHEASTTRCAEALRIAREANSASDVAMSLSIQAAHAIDRGNYEGAQGLLDEALSVSEAAEDRWQTAMALYWLGIIALQQGDSVRARALEEDALTIRREIQDRWAAGISLERLAELAVQQGDYPAARTFAAESLTIAREMGSKRGTARALWSLATAELAGGGHAAARERYLESLALWYATGERAFVPRALEGIAALAAARGALKTAFVLSVAAAHIRESLGIIPVPLERAFAARWLATIGQALSPQAIDAARAEGQALSPEKAIDLAGTAVPADAPARPAAESPAGGPGGLTARECEIAGLIVQGLSNRQIADALVLSERTVETHVAHIRAKLSLASRARIAVWAMGQGLAPASPS